MPNTSKSYGYQMSCVGGDYEHFSHSQNGLQKRPSNITHPIVKILLDAHFTPAKTPGMLATLSVFHYILLTHLDDSPAGTRFAFKIVM